VGRLKLSSRASQIAYRIVNIAVTDQTNVLLFPL